MRRLFICAATRAQAAMLARQFMLGPAQWQFIGDPNHLRGIRDSTVILYQTAIPLPSYDLLREVLITSGCAVLFVEDVTRNLPR